MQIRWPKVIRRLKSLFVGDRRRSGVSALLQDFPGISLEEAELVHKALKISMVSPERMVSLMDAVKHLEENGIEGDIVECGVWKGGSVIHGGGHFCPDRIAGSNSMDVRHF